MQHNYRRREFFAHSSAGEELAATFFMPDATANVTCLSLHGAGIASQSRVEPLCEGMASRMIASLSFDFSGHGLSSGNIESSSLRKKTAEALDMTAYLHPTLPLTVCGFSMAGEVALRLLPRLETRLQNLILFAPGIYATSAFEVEFGPQFSGIIRAPESWRQSDTPRLLRNFTGRLLIVIGEADDVIPTGVVDLLTSSAISAERVEVASLSGAPHQLGLWMRQNPKPANQLIERIVDFCAG